MYINTHYINNGVLVTLLLCYGQTLNRCSVQKEGFIVYCGWREQAVLTGRQAWQQALEVDGHMVPCVSKHREMGTDAQLALSSSFRTES